MRKVIPAIFFIIFCGFLFISIYELHDFGEPPSDMDDYIILNAQNDTGANNAVT